MKIMRILACIAYSLLLGFFGRFLAAQETGSYTLYSSGNALVIDGLLEEEGWITAPATNNFVVLGDNEAVPASVTWSKMLWDNNYLYISFSCTDTNVWATYTGRDDLLYQEDCFEVFIDADGNGLNYLEFEVNPLNTLFDLWLTKPWDVGGIGYSDWNIQGFLSAVTIHGTTANNTDRDGGWICEMAIPFSGMSFAADQLNYPPESGDQWRMNLYRCDRGSTNGTIFESSGWCQTGGGQHEPGYFGNVIFRDYPIAVELSPAMPEGITLLQNFPNPASGLTIIPCYFTGTCRPEIILTDLPGRIVYTLEPGPEPEGWRNVALDVSSLRPGTYFYFLQSGAQRSAVFTMQVLR